ncbi:hypothetical protein [Salinibacter ruber]|uniref:hypothetical protein n=1 Tax=Salinibacter ruber TaxID=146919 RepID=UPI002169E245|nr:hypothetical protein [Salinibacter ruber]MCS4150727.1 hypothetical protein [Salinibacter ruber]
MYDILIHPGYPKTATTTIQEEVFNYLDEAGKINYLGRHNNFTKGDYLSEFNHKVWKYVMENKNINIKGLEKWLSEYKLNVYSQESFIQPESHMKKKGYGTVSPVKVPEKLFHLFSDKNFNVTIIITIRAQSKISPSLYVQQYRLFKKDEEKNTWKKYMEKEVLSGSNIFYKYEKIIDAYAERFGVDNVFPVIYEGIKNKDNKCIKKLSGLLNVEEELIRKRLKHEKNVTDRKGDKFVQETRESHDFAKYLTENISTEVLKKVHNYMKTYKWYQKIIYKSKTHEIEEPTSRDVNEISGYFAEGNLKLAREFSITKRQLESYGYLRQN